MRNIGKWVLVPSLIEVRPIAVRTMYGRHTAVQTLKFAPLLSGENIYFKTLAASPTAVATIFWHALLLLRIAFAAK